MANGVLKLFIKDPVEGNVAIGSLIKKQWAPIDALLAANWALGPAAEGATTYHLSYMGAAEELQAPIKRLREVVSDVIYMMAPSQGVIVLPMPEMDELYYSNPPSGSSNSNSKRLYGAATNYKEHVDGAFKFPYISFYRALVGLTDGNTRVNTYFIKAHAGHKINKGDYVIFDFNRTRHKVIVEGDAAPTERQLLKLHYLVFDMGAAPSWLPISLYVTAVRHTFILYDHWTRALMAAGTDPTTYMEFFCGLLCELYTVRGSAFVCAAILAADCWLAGGWQLGLAAATLQWFAYVGWFWGRYQLTGCR